MFPFNCQANFRESFEMLKKKKCESGVFTSTVMHSFVRSWWYRLRITHGCNLSVNRVEVVEVAKSKTSALAILPKEFFRNLFKDILTQ